MNPLLMHVTADSLHVRDAPKRGGESLGFVSRGLAVTVSKIDDTGLWAKVNANGVDGWCSLKYLLPSGGDRAPWLATAHQEIGVKEVPGDSYHPRIYEYMATVNKLSESKKKNDDGTAWCSCFVNWCVEKNGHNGTDDAMARSWEKWRNGKPADSVKPGSDTAALVGDIAVGERESSASGKGHVAFFIAYDEKRDMLLLLGGNQSNAVRYSWYPRESTDPYGRLLTLRSL